MAMIYMKQSFKKQINIVFYAMIFLFSTKSVSAQKVRYSKNKEIVEFLHSCHNIMWVIDTVRLYSRRDYQWKQLDTVFYIAWKTKAAMGWGPNETYRFKSSTLDKNCEIKYTRLQWCDPKLLDKPLKKGKYLRFTKKGIIICFKDGSRRKFSYKELEEEPLQERLKREQATNSEK